MRRLGAALLVFGALAGASCGGEDRDTAPEQAVETSVDAIVDVPPRFLREPVRVEGTVVPIDAERFVLRGERETIIVVPEPGTVDDELGRGETVTVSGVVENFDRLQLAELERLLASGRYPALRDAPTERDDPFLSADAIQR